MTTQLQLINIIIIIVNFQHELSFTLVDWKFFPSRWWWWFPFWRCSFLCGSYRKHNIASPLIILLRNCLYQPYLWAHRKCLFLFLFVPASTLWDTKRWQTRRMCSASWRILWQLPAEIPTSDAVCSTVILLTLLTVSRTCWTFASFVDVDGRPLCGSSSAPPCPSWRR